MPKKSLGQFFSSSWSFIGIMLIWFIILELLLSGIFFIKDKIVPPGEVLVGRRDERVKADTYKGADWVAPYYEEFNESSRYRWKSYVNIRRRPYEGKYVNIDNTGMRFYPALRQERLSSKALKIFMFGGSTVWGSGVRDEFTLPVLVERGLRLNHIESRVDNFGETGYVSTQGVIELILQLQKGNVPDLVIFYDGVNDVFAAYQAGVAGLPQNESNRAVELSLSDPGRLTDITLMAVKGILKKTAIKRFVYGIKDKLRPTVVNAGFMPSDPAPMVNDIVSIYEKNMDIVKALAASYHFDYIFYWQPTIFNKPLLTDYEQQQEAKEVDVKPLYEKSYGLLNAHKESLKAVYRFEDISEIFATVKQPVFVDWCHPGEDGNVMIATEMTKGVLGLLNNRKSR